MEISITRILCPTDFSESADYALDYALCIAKRHHAHLEILHVAENSGYSRDAVNDQGQTYDDTLRDRLQALADSKPHPGIDVTVNVVDGVDHMEIVKRATDWPASLIVLGTHGRTGIRHLLIGSVAERVVRTAPCPVCTVRHPTLNPEAKGTAD
jgi:nucleotide-binding universal stress UspA family protein